MHNQSIAEMRRRIYRRIGIRSAVFAIWAASLLLTAFGGEADPMRGTYLYITFALFAAWTVRLVRDLRLLRNEDLLRKQAVERSDERSVFITYKATRMATVALLCILPVAICALSTCGMQEISDTLATVAGVFGLAYAASWAYFSKTC